MIDFKADIQKIECLLRCADTRILDIVDDQADFMEKDGALAINPKYGCLEDASEIIDPTNHFLAAIPNNTFDLALIKFDTHFLNEYRLSPESTHFPNPHCIYGTPGWDLAIDIAPLIAAVPTYMMAKNEFDMWGSNPTGVAREHINFTPAEAKAYNNLFKLIRVKTDDEPADLLANPHAAVDRDLFLSERINQTTVVTLLGVASDFCNYQAILGYLARGATVIVAEDLTRGIGGLASPAPNSGATQDVVKAILAQNPDYKGHIFTAQSKDVIAAAKKLTVQPVLANRPSCLKLAV